MSWSLFHKTTYKLLGNLLSNIHAAYASKHKEKYPVYVVNQSGHVYHMMIEIFFHAIIRD
jgi:hypothetical protein